MDYRDYLRLVPKIELHCHIVSTIRPERLIGWAAERGVDLPSDDPETLFDYERHEDLERRSHLFREVADVVDVMALLDDEVAVFVEIKILGVVLLRADLPQFFGGGWFHSRSVVL